MNKKFLSLLFTFLIGSCVFAELLTDDFVDSTIGQEELQQPEVHSKYDYTSTTKIPVTLTIVNNIKSENDIYEGQILKFLIKKEVKHNNKTIIQELTPATARVETISKSGMNGIPAIITLGDFEVKNINKAQLTEFHDIKGQDRSILVFPLKWALTILPPSGSLTNFIKGGHAKIKTNKPITIYYYPDWI